MSATDLVKGASLEIALPVEAGLALKGELDGLWKAVAREGGLTPDVDYEGLIPIAILLLETLGPPAIAAYKIEKQVAGVLEQLFHFLGGAGSALTAGENLLAIPVHVFEGFEWIAAGL